MTTTDVGFTGTGRGMTEFQKSELGRTLQALWEMGARRFHHGDCVGADAQAHTIAKRIGFYIIVHPGPNERYRAFCEADEILPVKPNLLRNHDIDEAVGLLLATPKEEREQLRSGTWATVRYMRKLKKPVQIIRPRLV